MSGRPRGRSRGKLRNAEKKQEVRRPGEGQQEVPESTKRNESKDDRRTPSHQTESQGYATGEAVHQMQRMSIGDGNRPSQQVEQIDRQSFQGQGARPKELARDDNRPSQQNTGYQQQGTRPKERYSISQHNSKYQDQGATPKERKPSYNYTPETDGDYNQQTIRSSGQEVGSVTSMIQQRTESKEVGTRPGGLTRYQSGIPGSSPYTDFVKTGTSGHPIQLLVNAFRFECTVSEWILYQYHVDFNPDIESKYIRIAMIADHKELLGDTRAFDGMTLFMPRRLGQKVTEVYSTLRSDNTQVRITITLVTELPPTSAECIKIYNIIFKKAQRILGNEQIGKNYYNPSLAISHQAYRIEIIPGFLAAIQKFEADNLLIIDVAHKIVQSDSVLTKMYQIYDSCQKRGNPNYIDDFWKSCERLVSGKIVLTRYNNKTYRVDEIDDNKRPSETFKLRNGQNITYIEYYKTHYNITDLDPDQPLLLCNPSKKDLKIGRREPIYLLPELCFITGLTDEISSDMKMKRDIQAHTRVNPQQRVQTLTEFVQQISSNEEIGKMMRGWNLQIPSHLLQIKGRQLDQEVILQRDKRLKFDLESCDWFKDMRSNILTTPVNLVNWIVIFWKKNQILTNDLIEALRFAGPPMGINVAQPIRIELIDDRIASYIEAFKANIERSTQLVMCILPTDREDRYNAIKKLCCIEHPVPSQMVVSRTISKKVQLRSVATKISAQINCKLGGELWTASMPTLKAGLMVVGIDIYHNKGSKNSVAGIVCSLNKECTRYYSSVVIQMAHQEVIDGLCPKIAEGLKKYHEVNGHLPGVIVVYRDGVGDGQLDIVIEHEVQQILDCFQRMGADYKNIAKLSVIIVKKRINQRLYLPESGRYRNPRPGTIVDSRITKSHWFDFFLVSQSVRQGTVSPTHYNVIHNTTHLSADQFQRLSYKLCHLYYNWTGTIRVPAPCQYAHKLAYLVGQNLNGQPSPALADRLYFL